MIRKENESVEDSCLGKTVNYFVVLLRDNHNVFTIAKTAIQTPNPAVHIAEDCLSAQPKRIPPTYPLRDARVTPLARNSLFCLLKVQSGGGTVSGISTGSSLQKSPKWNSVGGKGEQLSHPRVHWIMSWPHLPSPDWHRTEHGFACGSGYPDLPHCSAAQLELGLLNIQPAI